MPKQRSKFQLHAELALVRVIFWLFSLFPLRTSMSLGKLLGRTVPRLFPRLTKAAYRNLEIAMPANDSVQNQKIVRGTFESLGRHLGFISHFRYFEKEDLRDLVEIVGPENYYTASETGRGIIFFTGHFGSWEVFNLLPPAFDLQINILVRRLDNELVENYVDRMRTKFGSVTIAKRKAAMRMFRILERGEILGILGDLNAQNQDGVFVDFFGVPAATTTSIAKLALRTNAVLVPAFAVWEESKKKYVVYLEPAVEYENTGNAKHDIQKITEDFTAVIEKFVRKYPEQWLWVHKRWNTRPDGEKSLY